MIKYNELKYTVNEIVPNISGKANSITFAGFDGYDKSDPEHDQTEEILAKFKKKYFNKKMISLTKTSYKNLTFK